ncbi:2,3-diaminopropionate biosynthesis protein SbnB [Burkholderia gladioli]|uniref:Ornithine cyclodeaminase n=1 Tax=Burkholderia gladioli (strain BSR3) TaxID=999541 RepID=F2LRR5_BURGS|nr:2,3-diaminopropionate biosynthesis protein SbnB [Burkholderia gladioli]AEA65559.1 ornithine cyclodeaminase [Burkholderia gladioli BSR3]MBW5286686.1 2,3-diaminopropionate biosynthesis protein SbnB [Burkholderia gladioli]
MTLSSAPTLKIIGAAHIERWLEAHPRRVFELVEQAYLDHARGRALNPDSYFLRFPDSDRNRIIALPAVLEDERPIAGLKWISSFPENVAHGRDRASAMLVLNDRRTGYPLACLEGSVISAARTAASAALGARRLHPTPGSVERLAVVGCGPIAFRTVSMLHALGWRIGELALCDLSAARAALFLEKCAALGLGGAVRDTGEALQASDMALFATSAVTPGDYAPAWFAHAPTVLHMSLRDLPVSIVAAAQNVADDVSHCLKANTSLDLAVRQLGRQDFIEGGIADAIEGRIAPDPARARIYSPFGMGVLDLAVAREILAAAGPDQSIEVGDFFPVPYQAQAGSPA